jgi:predicted ATPase with chaperone activity
MPSTVDATWQVVPRAPVSLAESGLSLDLVTQLTLKTLHFAGELSGNRVAERLGLPWAAVEPSLEALKQQRHVEVAGGSFVGGASYRFRITDAGRARAVLFLEANGYVGTAPVPLAQYRAYVRDFSECADRPPTPAAVRAAFPHMIVADDLLDLIGPTIADGHSLFLYGEAGNGKTQLARGLRDVLAGDIAVPHALEVEGQIVRIFDPVTHTPVALPEASAGLDLGNRPDRRWVRCQRPLVVTGGELTLDHLQLGRSPGGYYKAPPQLLATGGVLVVDDFGRQRCTPTELLNRWIVPLESREDYLTLASGQSFSVPFRALLVFATNLRPQELVDEAFLRRIHAKVRIPNPTRDQYGRIFELRCAAVGVAFDTALVSYLLDGFYRTHDLPLRGCHPRDLIDHALRLAAYRGEPRRLTPAMLDAACRVYFVTGDHGSDA